jgi:hypothetical protein
MKLLLITIGLLLFVGASLYLWFFFKPSQLATYGYLDSKIVDICHESPVDGVQILILGNQNGDIGGFFVFPKESTPGWSGTLYDSSGEKIMEGSSIPGSYTDMMSKVEKLKVDFPFTNTVSC